MLVLMTWNPLSMTWESLLRVADRIRSNWFLRRWSADSASIGNCSSCSSSNRSNSSRGQGVEGNLYIPLESLQGRILYLRMEGQPCPTCEPRRNLWWVTLDLPSSWIKGKDRDGSRIGKYFATYIKTFVSMSECYSPTPETFHHNSLPGTLGWYTEDENIHQQLQYESSKLSHDVDECEARRRP